MKKLLSGYGIVRKSYMHKLHAIDILRKGTAEEDRIGNLINADGVGWR